MACVLDANTAKGFTTPPINLWEPQGQSFRLGQLPARKNRQVFLLFLLVVVPPVGIPHEGGRAL